jgi:hypothetical protein
MAVYDPATHKRPYAISSSSLESIWAVDVLLRDMAAAGMIDLIISASTPAAGDQGKLWLHQVVGVAGAPGIPKRWDGVAWTALTKAGLLAHLGGAALSGATFTGPVELAANAASAMQAVTLQQLQQAIYDLDPKADVVAATTGNVVLSGTQTIDGIALGAGNRVLVKDQTDATQNGIYVVAAGAWSRAVDANGASEMTSGVSVYVGQGSINGKSAWVMTTTGTILLGTSAITFERSGGPRTIGSII